MSDEIHVRLKRVRDKLTQVQRLKPAGFGWEAHRYCLHPPLGEKLLANFEQSHGVTLPTEFRRFILELGDGGAGPAYGLLTYKNWGEWRSRDGTDTLALKCPIFPGMGDSPLHVPEGADPWDGLLNGTIAIVSEGCSFSIMLIVTGDYRGRVVRVDAEDDGYPYVTDDPDFLAWYERWLDHLLWGWDASDAGDGLPGTEAQIVEFLQDNLCSDRDRREALRTLLRVNAPTEETKRLTLAQLEAVSPRVVAEALKIVDKHSWSDRDGIIAGLLQHPDSEVRWWSIRVLGKTKRPGWAELVRPHLSDSDDEVSFKALCVLMDGRQVQRNDLAPLIDSPFPRQRKTGIWAWGKCGFSVSGASWFVDRLRDEDIEVARSVILACNDSKDRGILPYLPELKARAGGKFDVLDFNVRKKLSGLPSILADQFFAWRTIVKWLLAKRNS